MKSIQYNMTSVIYVAGAYGGKEINKERIEETCRELSVLYPKYCFINGVSEFAHWYGIPNSSITQDLQRCITLLKKCDEIWIMTESDWEHSQGAMVEMFVAYENKMPICYIDRDKNGQLYVTNEWQ